MTISGSKEQQTKAGELIFGLMQESDQTSIYKNMTTNYGGQQPAEYPPPAPVYSQYPPAPAPFRGYGQYTSTQASPRPPPHAGVQETVTMQVPDAIVGALVGKGGKVIVDMQHQSGARIQISNRDQMVEGTTDRVVTITGDHHAVATAQFLINQKMQQTQQARAHYATAAPAHASPPGY